MTTEQLDHLRRIDAHLANLLSTAEKRTPGEWFDEENVGLYNGSVKTNQAQPWTGGGVASCFSENDAAFISACAGNAEAGWRATRSLIDYLLMMHKHGDGYRYVGLTEDLLAAFPNV